jgi:hypothetical protein
MGLASSAGATGELADESLDFQRGSNDSCQNRGAYLGHEHRVGQLRYLSAHSYRRALLAGRATNASSKSCRFLLRGWRAVVPDLIRSPDMHRDFRSGLPLVRSAVRLPNASVDTSVSSVP